MYGEDVGGLIGGAGPSQDGGNVLIEKVYSNVKVEVDGNTGGGLLGGLDAIVNGWSSTSNVSATLRNAYSWSQVGPSDSSDIGGLIGHAEARNEGSGNSAMTIQNTYASGTVDGETNVAGLIGSIWIDRSSVDMTNNFAKGQVTVTGSTNRHGGLIGEVGGDYWGEMEFTGNYYDRSGTGQEYCSQQDMLDNCTAVNTDDSQAKYFIGNNSNAPMNTWNFSSIWVANAGIPPTFEVKVDTDPISEEVENAAPNNGDANNDGILDTKQSNVASFVNPLTGKYAVLAVSDECSITAVSIASEDSNTPDSGYKYPAGLMDFTLDCGKSGFTADIKQYHYGVTGNFVARKYDPNTKTYATIQGASVANQTIAGNQAKVASYKVTDGDKLDTDNAANGIIKDPAGLAQLIGSSSQSGGDLADTGLRILGPMLLAGSLIAAGLVVRNKKTKKAL